jgi:molybdenum cofactor cytidylyltransferase
VVIASLVLAAGGSSRMGQPKGLLPGDRGTLLLDAVLPHLEAGITHVVLVLGADADLLLSAAGLPPHPALSVVRNPEWQEGLSSSLRCGLASCGDAAAVLIALADQPEMTAARIRAVCDAFAPGVPLVLPVGPDGRPSHPVLFARELFDELRAVRGDVGGREVVARHRARALEILAPPLRDLDTPEDYRDWKILSGTPAPRGKNLS